MEIVTSLIFLSFLEIILGIDNLIFIYLASDKLPKHLKKRIRTVGLMISLVLRLVLLYFVVELLKFTTPLFTIFNTNISIKDLVMIGGGLFLIVKSTLAIHDEVLSKEAKREQKKNIKTAVFSVLMQIIIIDIVFSLDSLITAVGLTTHYYVIAAAIIISIIAMVLFSGMVSEFINKYPTLKMLALSFIMIIGVFLILEGLSIKVDKGYIYFAMGFSLLTEFLNIIVKERNKKKVP